MGTTGKDPFEALAESCNELVFVTSHAMRMLYASPRLEMETGFTTADFQFPQDDNPFIHREDAEHVASALTAFLGTPLLVSDPIENRFLDRWGRTHRYRSVITKIDYAGDPALLFVCRVVEAPSPDAADVQQYRALVESADDAIVRFDSGGRFLFANRRTHELLGYSAVELGRLRLDDIVAPHDVGTFTSQLANVVGALRPVRFELQLFAKDARPVRVHMTLTSLGPFGHTGELLVVMRPLLDPPA